MRDPAFSPVYLSWSENSLVVDIVKTVAVAPKDYIAAIAAMSLY